MAAPTTLRWTAQRKAVLLLALDYQLMTTAEITARYLISTAELEAWRRDTALAGVPGLRSTRLQIYHGRGRP